MAEEVEEVPYPSVPIIPEDMTEEEFCATLDISYAELAKRQAFIDAVATGTDPLLAGIEMGWSIYKAKQVIAEMGDLIDLAQNVVDLRVSAVIADRALQGHEWAVKLWMFNRRPDLFRDVRHIQHTHTDALQPHVIAATIDAVKEVTREALTGGRLRELQPVIEVGEVGEG